MCRKKKALIEIVVVTKKSRANRNIGVKGVSTLGYINPALLSDNIPLTSQELKRFEASFFRKYG